MAQPTSNVTEPAERVLVIERIFDAPRHLVFQAWTEPERMMHWYGPKGYTMTRCELDPREGGAYFLEMRSPEGTYHRSQGNIRELKPPERMVWDGGWVDEHGTPGHQTRLTVTFTELGDKTKLTLHQAIFESVEARNSHNNGWTSSFDCLADYLAAA